MVMTNRRKFLSGVAGIAALAGCYTQLDDDRLSGIPGIGDEDTIDFEALDYLLIETDETVEIETDETESWEGAMWESDGTLDLNGGVLEIKDIAS